MADCDRQPSLAFLASSCHILGMIDAIRNLIEVAFGRHHGALNRKLDWIINRLGPKPHPTRLAFELPTRTRNGIIMANFELANDAVYTITLKAVNSAGAFEPLPAGDTFTATSSDPTVGNAVMGVDAAGNPALVVNAMTRAGTWTATVTDSSGLTAATQVFDNVEDATPTALVLDLADATHVPQPVPAT